MKYLFKGNKYEAPGKDVLLRNLGIKPTAKLKRLVWKVKKSKQEGI